MTQAAVISGVVAFFIGVVVSLDVGGLLISQHKEFKERGIFWKSIRHSLMHAITHALLFLVYFYAVVYIVLPVPAELIKWLATFDCFPPINIAEALKTMMLLSSIIIIIFVWITYAGKIAENHVLKAAPDEDKSVARRIDILIFYWFAVKCSPGRKSGLFYMALAVAVDMLAITSFIRVFFKTAPDASNPVGQTSGTLLHFEFSAASPWLDPLIFAVIIFSTVLICSIVAIMLARSASDARNKSYLRQFRVAEPFMIFWLLAVAVDHLFGNSITPTAAQADDVSAVISAYAGKIAVGAIVAFVLTYLLVAYHGWKNITDWIDAGFDNLDMSRLDEIRVINKDGTLKKFILSVFLLILLLVVIFFASHSETDKQFNGVSNFINVGSMIVSGLSLLLLFIPRRSLSEFEIEKSDILHQAEGAQADGPLSPVFCIALSYFVMLLYIHFSFSGLNIFNVGDRETFFWPLVSLGLVVLATWFLLWWRTEKKKHFISDADEKRRNHFNRNFGDLLSAFAGVVFIWQFGMIFL